MWTLEGTFSRLADVASPYRAPFGRLPAPLARAATQTLARVVAVLRPHEGIYDVDIDDRTLATMLRFVPYMVAPVRLGFPFGLLLVEFGDGFVPQIGDSFELIQAESVDGEFDAVIISYSDGAIVNKLGYGDHTVELHFAARPSRGDLDQDGTVGTGDLLTLLNQFGSANSESDLNQDGTVDVSDLLILLQEWSP